MVSTQYIDKNHTGFGKYTSLIKLPVQTAQIEAQYQNALVATQAQQRMDMAKELPIIIVHIKNQKKYTEKEKNTIIQIETLLVLLSNDPVIHVRKTLVETLKKNPQAISPPLAVSIAEDDDHIAIPFLKKLNLLDDEQIAQIISKSIPKRHAIIAMQENIGPKTTRVIIEKSPLNACLILLQNKNVQLNEQDYKIIIKRHGITQNMQNMLAARQDLPIWLKIMLTCAMTAKMRLKTKQKIKQNNQQNSRENYIDHIINARRMIDRAEENAFIRILKQTEEKNIQNAITELEKRGKLLPQLILNALCHGEINIAAHLLSFLAKMPFNKIKNMIKSQYALSRRVIQKRAKLPENILSILQIVGEIIRYNPHLEKQNNHDADGDNDIFVQKMIENVIRKKIHINQKYTILRIIGEYGPKNAQEAITEIMITMHSDAELIQNHQAQNFQQIPMRISA